MEEQFGGLMQRIGRLERELERRRIEVPTYHAARVESVTVSLDKGQETVSAAIQGDVAS